MVLVEDPNSPRLRIIDVGRAEVEPHASAAHTPDTET